jgi:hypothetical protein
MSEDDLNRYFASQVLLDESIFYAIEYVDATVCYCVKAACLGESGGTYSFYTYSFYCWGGNKMRPLGGTK